MDCVKDAGFEAFKDIPKEKMACVTSCIMRKRELVKKGHRTSPMRKSSFVRLDWWHNVGNILGNNFTIGQKSVGHLVWPVGVKSWASLCVQVEWEWERETLHKGPFPFLVSLTQERSSLIWPLKVKPIDLPTFGKLESCSLRYSLHCIKFSAKSNRGGSLHGAGAMSFSAPLMYNGTWKGDLNMKLITNSVSVWWLDWWHGNAP